LRRRSASRSARSTSARGGSADEELRRAYVTATEEALSAMPRLAAERGIEPEVTDELRTEYERWLRVLRTGDEEATARESHYVELRLAVIARKHATVVRMRDRGEIDDEVLLRLQDRLDTETVRLEQNRAGGPL
jgi:hypothetical protein